MGFFSSISKIGNTYVKQAVSVAQKTKSVVKSDPATTYCQKYLNNFTISSEKTNQLFAKEKGLTLDLFKNEQRSKQLKELMSDSDFEVCKNMLSDEGVKSVDYITGYSAKRGKFKIVSLWMENGDLNRRTLYEDKDYIKDSFIRRVDNQMLISSEESIRGEQLSTKMHFFEKRDGGQWLSTQEIIEKDSICDEHFVEKLEAGKRKQQIMYYFDWDSDKSAWVKTTPDAPERFSEFLPLFVSYAKQNEKKVINYIGEMEERNLGILGLVTKPIKIKNLSEDCGGTCCPLSGVITLNKKYMGRMNKYLLETIAHEEMHRLNFSDYVRGTADADDVAILEKIKNVKNLKELERLNESLNDEQLETVIASEKRFPGMIKFFVNSMKRGQLAKDDSKAEFFKAIEKEIKDYENLCKTIGHDYLECEKSANAYAKSETDLHEYFYENIFKYLPFKEV